MSSEAIGGGDHSVAAVVRHQHRSDDPLLVETEAAADEAANDRPPDWGSACIRIA